jgi:release factor glutamine methyltransferase
VVAFAIGEDKEFIIANPELVLNDDQLCKIQELFNRRINGEPLSYIIGVREFWKDSFRVTRDTLDPRPDSEALIELALKVCPDLDKNIKIIDFGTGTGCLLLSLLGEYKNATGVGIDISKGAIEVARENSSRVGVKERAEFINEDWQKLNLAKFDLIISNPPYICENEIPNLSREVREHEPRLALVAGDDGLKCYRELAIIFEKIVDENSVIILELGYTQYEGVLKIFNKFEIIDLAKDLNEHGRAIALSLK